MTSAWKHAFQSEQCRRQEKQLLSGFYIGLFLRVIIQQNHYSLRNVLCTLDCVSLEVTFDLSFLLSVFIFLWIYSIFLKSPVPFRRHQNWSIENLVGERHMYLHRMKSFFPAAHHTCLRSLRYHTVLESGMELEI